MLNTYEFIQIHSNIFVRSAYTSLAVRFGVDGHAYCNICQIFWDFVQFLFTNSNKFVTNLQKPWVVLDFLSSKDQIAIQN